MPCASVISIGTELALGQTVDTNTAWLARQLAEIGWRCRRHVTVADERADIREQVVSCAASTDAVLVTGGLGPTEDDLTRQALADAAGCELVPDAAALERIRVFFALRGREMPEQNRVQALRPATGRLLENRCGTAPGVEVNICGTPVYALPGVPGEMKEMFAREVLPALRARGGGRVLQSRVLHTVGMPESELGARIADLMRRGRNPEVGTSAALGLIDVRIYAEAESPQAAQALLDADEALIRSRLGAYVFGRNGQTLAGAVGELLVQRGETVCLAESCTGGLIGAWLTDVAGSSRYFLGGCVAYADAIKQALLGVPAETLAAHGAVSEATARCMAGGARERFRATHALSVTGIAGPTGATADKPVGLVYIGLAGPSGVRVHEYRFGPDSSRDVVRVRAARQALALLRRALL